MPVDMTALFWNRARASYAPMQSVGLKQNQGVGGIWVQMQAGGGSPTEAKRREGWILACVSGNARSACGVGSQRCGSRYGISTAWQAAKNAPPTDATLAKFSLAEKTS